MKIKSFEFSFIKAFKSLHFDLEKTSVLIGQNDHGKSSILKALDIVLNQLDKETLQLGALHPDLAERLLPIFPVNAKARRITLNYDEAGVEKQLYITVRADLTFTVLEEVHRNAKTTPTAVATLEKLRGHNRFVLIPALRDASSAQFQELFSKMLREHGLSKMIPQKAGGTPREYRTLKAIRDRITEDIKPYVNEALLPQIEKNFGFRTQHKLGLKFNVDVQQIGQWILNNLQLGFQLTDDENVTLALSEAGSGVQSGVLLALHRLEQKAAESPQTQFILAVEEPEAFLHPQKQKELYQNIQATKTKNLKIIVTTHSPCIVAETPFTDLGLVRKEGEHCALHTPYISTRRDAEIFNAYSSEVNNLLFFADKVVLVEGESDQLVLETLLRKKLGAEAHRITVISAAGNKNFSPFLRMICAWKTANIPHLVVTDFDSLTTDTDRAIIQGAHDAGYSHASRASLQSTADAALDKGESEFCTAALAAEKYFKNAGLNVFIFTSDLEFSLITDHNKEATAKILTSESATKNDYSTGYSLIDLKKQIGSKGVPLNPLANPTFKKPYIHKKIAESLDINHLHKDLSHFLDLVVAL
ncbi:MAG TPA: AAA family ATPase [Candidatus Sulfotelmatobacter sp.]|nr:AAA family ATPase [Candidatus Sulfotelmatobacter sp.]